MSEAVVTLRLTVEEAKLLHENLAYRIAAMDHELVRTDQHQMQHALAEDVKHLNLILERLGTLTSDAVRS